MGSNSSDFEKPMKRLQSSHWLIGNFGEIVPTYFCADAITLQKVDQKIMVQIKSKYPAFKNPIELKKDANSESWSGSTLSFESQETSERKTTGTISIQITLNEIGEISAAPNFSASRVTNSNATGPSNTLESSTLEAFGRYRMR
jgi:hypothetical protein